MYQEYATGFLFNTNRTKVVLLEKIKPMWQRGRLNGVGGKVEPGESALVAMRREFLEEADLEVLDWRQFITLSGPGFAVNFFYAFETDARLTVIRSVTEEQVGVYDLA